MRASLEDAIDRPPPLPLFAPREPSRLRPCCAFGHDLRVKIGVVPVPWFHLETVRGPGGIGAHEYSPGLVQILPSASRRSGGQPARENNGIVYTCRGGFVDTAHVRDFADYAWFLAGRITPLLSHGGTVSLTDLGGRRRIVVQPVEAHALRRVGAASLAVALAAKLSFELSVWREIATWYGYESVPPWPETISTFSLEDLYSNLLGTKIASGILRTTPIASRSDWERAMNAWLPAALETIGVVSKDDAAEAFEQVEGRWWDSSRRIPDWKVTMRRRFDAGPVVEPLLVEAAASPVEATVASMEAAASPIAASTSPETSRTPRTWPCAPETGALPLRVADRFAGVPLASVARFEVVADPALVREGLVLPRDRRRLDARDFPPILAAIEAETAPALAVRR